MRINSKAQSVIEYTTVIVLVIVGVLIMGPYVIRSINAFFKGGELQVEDSFREDIIQGPPTGGQFPTCDCDNYHVGACGDGFSCEYTQRVLTKYCEPLGCEDYFGIPIVNPVCQYDDDCCTPPEETGRCGDESLYAGCAYGEMEMIKYCGEGLIPKYECEPNPDCIFACEGLPLHPAARWCGYEAYHFTEVPPNTPITYVPPGWCTEPVPSVKCEAECIGELITNGSFELPPHSPPPAPHWYTVIPGWRETSNAGCTQPFEPYEWTPSRIEIQSHGVAGSPHHGTQLVEVDCSSMMVTDPPLETAPGQLYKISFYYSPRPGRPADRTRVGVHWNNTLLEIIARDGTGFSDTVWERYTYQVVAQGNDVLSFSDQNSPPWDGGYIDSVSVKYDGPGNPCAEAADPLIYCVNDARPAGYGFTQFDPPSGIPTGLSETATCPEGMIVHAFGLAGWAERNTDWNDDQGCRAWVSQVSENTIRCDAEINFFGGEGCSSFGVGYCAPASPPERIACETCRGDYGFGGGCPSTDIHEVTCPFGTKIAYFSQIGHAQHGTDWNNNQRGATWVQETLEGIACHSVVHNGSFERPGQGNRGLAVCIPNNTPRPELIACSRQIGPQGENWTFADSPNSVSCSPGKKIMFFTGLGHSEKNTDWNDTQGCRAWVQKDGDDTLSCHAQHHFYAGGGCGIRGLAVCK